MKQIFYIIPISTILVFFLVKLWLYLAKSKNLFDVPNKRSSHSVPTLKSGGVSIIFVFYFFLSLIFIKLPWFEPNYYYALLIGGGSVAVISFFDDIYELSILFRLLVQFFSAFVTLSLLGGLAPIEIYAHQIDQGFIINVLAAFFIVWMINLYNFMDGINGIASFEIIFSSLSLFFLCVYFDKSIILWFPPLLLGSCTLGFLFWNYPRAKIFMGDVGSGFIGYSIAAFVIFSSWRDQDIFWVWLILLAVFVSDTTFTLILRISRSEKFYSAHKDHLYQLLSRYFSPDYALLLILAFNLVWLFPISFLVTNNNFSGFTGVCFAYIPLLIIYIYYRMKIKPDYL